MKHAIASTEYLIQMKGYRHGACGLPVDPAHEGYPEYQKGYSDGQKWARVYSNELCIKLHLENPNIQAV